MPPLHYRLPARSAYQKLTFSSPSLKIGKNRRVSHSVFKGHGLVNIREYYLAPDGEIRPGKKVRPSPAVVLVELGPANSSFRGFRCQ